MSVEIWEADQPWRLQAFCRDMDPYISPFFVTQGGSTAEAKTICFGGEYLGVDYPGCEVRLECLRYSIEAGERFGLWGGRSQGERKELVAVLAGEHTDEPTDNDLIQISNEEDPDSGSPGLLLPTSDPIGDAIPD